jgi:hypothetical protein
MATTLKIKNGDIAVFGHSGRPILLSGADKLVQDMVEFFSVDVTRYGFGAGLNELVGTIPEFHDMVIGLATRSIRDGINRYMKLQRIDPTTPLSDDERVVGMDSLKVYQDPTDETRYFFTVNIVTASGNSIPLPKIGFGA